GENTVTGDQDEAHVSVDLTSIFGPSGINFFGTSHTEITVDLNGLVYFPVSGPTGNSLLVSANRDDYAFYNFGSLGSGDFQNPTLDPNTGEIRSWQHGPINGDVSGLIAPFWSDVWTATSPTLSPGGNSTGSNHVYWDVDTVTKTLTVTWDDVGSF